MSTLYVTEPGVRVHKKGKRLLIRRGKEVLQDIPMIKIDRVVLMGRGVSVTTPALFALTYENVDVLYLTGRGGYVSRVVGREHKHSKLRHAQAIAVTNQGLALDIAKNIAKGKIHNQRVLVQRHAEGARWAKRALKTMAKMVRRVESSQNLDEVRGLEGTAAKEYFAIMRKLMRPPKDGSSWGLTVVSITRLQIQSTPCFPSGIPSCSTI